LTGENVTAGLGFTVMVYCSEVLGHPLAVAMTDILAVIEAVPLFTGVNTGIFPAPFAINPIAGLELVHA
jgi:hypothetical protein